MLELLLILLLAYFLTGFVCSGILQKKFDRGPKYYLGYGLVFYLSVISPSVFFLHASWLTTPRFHLVVIGLTTLHVLSEVIRGWLIHSRKAPDDVRAFLLDNVLRLFASVFAALLGSGESFATLTMILERIQASEVKWLALVTVYLGVIFGGGSLVRYLTRPLLEASGGGGGESIDELRNAGLYIGWLERFLVLTAILLQSPTTVGLVITAKSIVRYHKMNSPKFAEYFLIGTLLSIGVAILGGIILLKVFRGTVILPE